MQLTEDADSPKQSGQMTQQAVKSCFYWFFLGFFGEMFDCDATLVAATQTGTTREAELEESWQFTETER